MPVASLTKGLLLRTSTTLLCTMAAPRVVDEKYPGTSVARMLAARERATSLKDGELDGESQVLAFKADNLHLAPRLDAS